jgi:hypothetical protein
MSTAIDAKQKREMLERVSKLVDAVKVAREDANQLEVTNKDVAKDLLNYVFEG